MPCTSPHSSGEVYAPEAEQLPSAEVNVMQEAPEFAANLAIAKKRALEKEDLSTRPSKKVRITEDDAALAEPGLDRKADLVEPSRAGSYSKIASDNYDQLEKLPDSLSSAKRPREEDGLDLQHFKKAHIADDIAPPAPSRTASQEKPSNPSQTPSSQPIRYAPPDKSQANIIFPPRPWPTTPQEETDIFIKTMKTANDTLQTVLKYRSMSRFTRHIITTQSELRAVQFFASTVAAREYEKTEFPEFAYATGKKLGDRIRELKARCKWNGKGRGKSLQRWSITSACPTARFYYRLFGLAIEKAGGKMDLEQLEKITGKLGNPDRGNDSLLTCKEIQYWWNEKKSTFTVWGIFSAI